MSNVAPVLSETADINRTPLIGDHVGPDGEPLNPPGCGFGDDVGEDGNPKGLPGAGIGSAASDEVK